jgi:hypothetical protein
MAFFIFVVFLVLYSLNMSSPQGLLSFSDVWLIISVINFGKLSVIISLNIFSAILSCFLSGIPITYVSYIWKYPRVLFCSFCLNFRFPSFYWRIFKLIDSSLAKSTLLIILSEEFFIFVTVLWILTVSSDTFLEFPSCSLNFF